MWLFVLCASPVLGQAPVARAGPFRPATVPSYLPVPGPPVLRATPAQVPQFVNSGGQLLLVNPALAVNSVIQAAPSVTLTPQVVLQIPPAQPQISTSSDSLAKRKTQQTQAIPLQSTATRQILLQPQPVTMVQSLGSPLVQPLSVQQVSSAQVSSNPAVLSQAQSVSQGLKTSQPQGQTQPLPLQASLLQQPVVQARVQSSQGLNTLAQSSSQASKTQSPISTTQSLSTLPSMSLTQVQSIPNNQAPKPVSSTAQSQPMLAQPPAQPLLRSQSVSEGSSPLVFQPSGILSPTPQLLFQGFASPNPFLFSPTPMPRLPAMTAPPSAVLGQSSVLLAGSSSGLPSTLGQPLRVSPTPLFAGFVSTAPLLSPTPVLSPTPGPRLPAPSKPAEKIYDPVGTSPTDGVEEVSTRTAESREKVPIVPLVYRPADNLYRPSKNSCDAPDACSCYLLGGRCGWSTGRQKCDTEGVTDCNECPMMPSCPCRASDACGCAAQGPPCGWSRTAQVCVPGAVTECEECALQPHCNKTLAPTRSRAPTRQPTSKNKPTRSPTGRPTPAPTVSPTTLVAENQDASQEDYYYGGDFYYDDEEEEGSKVIEVKWVFRSEPFEDVKAKVGGSLRFLFNDDHDVWAFRTLSAFETCNFTRAVLQADSDIGGGTDPWTNSFQVEFDRPGILLFACSRGDHCQNGHMRLRVEVEDA